MTDPDRLRQIFRTVLYLPADSEVDALEYRGIETWDSLAHMELVATIEDEFDILIDTDDVIAMSSFGKALELLERCRA